MDMKRFHQKYTVRTRGVARKFPGRGDSQRVQVPAMRAEVTVRNDPELV